MTLETLATEENWQAFDDAWTALMMAEEPVEPVIRALEVAASKRRLARCLPILREHVALLDKDARHADAAHLIGAAVRGGGPIGELGASLLEHAQKAWGEEPWWPIYVELTDLNESSLDLRGAWVRFDEMRAYQKGTVVFHAAGWGVGAVTKLYEQEMECDVTFASGRSDRFPLATAVDIFERLPDTDLRAQHLNDPEGLKKKIQKEPLEVLRAVLERYGGRATTPMLKNALAQVAVDGSRWTTFWRKARTAAENSPWFRITGTSTKAEARLLKRASDPTETLKRDLRNAPDLKSALNRVRDILRAESLEAEVRAAAVDALADLAAQPDFELERRIEAWMLLRNERGETPEAFHEMLVEAAKAPTPEDYSVAPALWTLMQLVPNMRDQEKSVPLLEDVYGEAWLDEAARNLQHAPPGMVKPLIEALVGAKRHEDLVRQYAMLLARPMCSPFSLVALSKKLEGSKHLEKAPADFPGAPQRALALVELAVRLEGARVGKPDLARAQARLQDLLVKGPKPLLRRLLVDAEIGTLRSLKTMLSRRTDDQVDALVTDILIEQAPELMRSSDNDRFWADEERIWTSRAGLERRDQQRRELVDVKIPENAEAIARAASYGDLSENAEWEQAMADQRQLTAQAAEMETELRSAELLENAPVPEDTVAPGTEVTYVDLGDKQSHTIRILGPWDQGANVVSYRAPLARGLLGLKIGEEATVELPSGTVELRVASVRLIELV